MGVGWGEPKKKRHPEPPLGDTVKAMADILKGCLLDCIVIVGILAGLGYFVTHIP